MIWLIGSKGMLGTHLAEMFEKKNVSFVGTDVELDITDDKQVEGFVSARSFSHIINCAAYNAVDNAEDDVHAAFRLNGKALEILSEAANATGACLIHFSTDYVFDGTKQAGYTETDTPKPLSRYGASKLEGERTVVRLCERYFLFRISWLYGPHGNNFVHTMLRLFDERDTLNVVDDQFGSPTYTNELAGFVSDLAASGNTQFGLYHFSGEGVASWYEFAAEIYRLARKYNIASKAVVINPVDSSHYPTKAKRPAYSYMKKDKLVQSFGFRPRNWRKSLEAYIQSLSDKKGAAL